MATPLELNAQGFEGDKFLKEEFQRLIDKHDIKVIVETGTYLGNTTAMLAKMVDTVFTIEQNREYFDVADEKLQQARNVINLIGSSPAVLPNILEGRSFNHALPPSALFFLDAHWGDNNPLLRELEIIAQRRIKPVIIIHDFKVPDHPELGFDSYDGQDYEWPWIEKAVENIYGLEGYTYHYNTQAEGARRGVIFIEPK